MSSSRSIVFFCRFLIVSLLFLASAPAQETIRLWPEKKMPNSKGMVLEERETNNRISQVGTPRLEIFLPAKEAAKGAAVIIIPGGGYQHLNHIWGGEQFAKWYNTFGVAAFVLIYRLPTSPDLLDRQSASLQDAQRALRLVRANAERWGIHPDHIGVMGVSAGGHLAATVGTHGEDVSLIGDSLDAISFQPDFMMLISPVIDLGMFAHAGSRDNLLGQNAPVALVRKFSNHLQVTSSTPPCFLVHAANDKSVRVQNSLMFHQALVDSGVQASLHVFPYGAHSIYLRDNPGSTGIWTALAEAWMREMGFIADAGKPQ